MAVDPSRFVPTVVAPTFDLWARLLFEEGWFGGCGKWFADLRSEI
jgi:hypothetical protein